MPTTFNVVSLGNLADIDTTEGNFTAESAGALVGQTFGGLLDSLVNDFVEFSPGSTGFGGGTSTAYDQDNSPAETFRIDGGPDQTFDSSVIYNATITYIDGTTDTITAVIFQDTAGNTYWAPEFSANADQTSIEFAAIRSLSLDSLSGSAFLGLTGNRQDWDFVTCFTPGTLLETPDGPVEIGALQVGDALLTQDNGPQTIRWIGKTTCLAKGKLAPVRIAKGALGPGQPQRDLVVSPQHRVLVRSKIAGRMTGFEEVLVAAKDLLSHPGVETLRDATVVTYVHVLLDRHEVIFAEGCATESLLTGPVVLREMSKDTLDELEAIFPELYSETAAPARSIVKGARASTLLQRHIKNEKSLVA